MTTRNFLAIDLGAESGRAVVGRLNGDALALEEVHRFANRPVWDGTHMTWNVDRLHREILRGLYRATALFGRPTSVGIDTWGVDFGLLDRSGGLLEPPRHYRDPYTEGAMDQLFAEVPRERVFELTGVQFLRFNTLFQLYAMSRAGSAALDRADRLLMMPDLFHHRLTGEVASEHSIASTTQAYSVASGGWVTELFEQLALPSRILPPVVQPATDLGRVRGFDVRVVAPACHDSASAVAAVPASSRDHAYISSGTWSVMGAVLDAPLVNNAVREAGFTNEGGVEGTVRFLKNLTGLWLVQECRRSWSLNADPIGYSELVRMAEDSGPFGAVIDPDHPSLVCPDDMPAALQRLCASTRQRVPTGQGEILRVALESLACKYRATLEKLERLTGTQRVVVHVVGGGSRNRLLCQLTADVCDRLVLAGPTETSALGNVLCQALASGDCRSWDDARALVRRAFDVEVYEPRAPSRWAETYSRFQSLAAA